MIELPYKFKSDQIIQEGRTTIENVNFITSWLNTGHNEIIPQLQDELIIIFLLSCNNNLELTKNTIKMYFQCKKDAPELFNDRSIDECDNLKLCLKTIYISSFPVRTDENYAIHFFKLNDCSYSNFHLIPAMKLSYMLLDVTQEENLPNGLVVVFDTEGLNLMHLTRFMRPDTLKKYVKFLQEGFPLQLKVIHIINRITFLDKLLSLVKMFMKSEIMDLIKIHSINRDNSKEILFNILPKKCWPANYGGDLPPVEKLHDLTIQQFKSKKEFWILEQEMRETNNNC